MEAAGQVWRAKACLGEQETISRVQIPPRNLLVQGEPSFTLLCLFVTIYLQKDEGHNPRRTKQMFEMGVSVKEDF